jgi:hypothetical protein
VKVNCGHCKGIGSINGLIVTHSIATLYHYAYCRFAECHSAECRYAGVRLGPIKGILQQQKCDMQWQM